MPTAKYQHVMRGAKAVMEHYNTVYASVMQTDVYITENIRVV